MLHFTVLLSALSLRRGIASLPIVRYEELPTEQQNPRSRDLDLKSMPELLRVIHEEDRRVPDAVEQALPAIAVVAERAARALGGAGRLIYVGAGTSGRLGVLDAAECPPTKLVRSGTTSTRAWAWRSPKWTGPASTAST